MSHTRSQFSACSGIAGSQDTQWTAVAALNGNLSAISFQSVNFPTRYFGILQGVANAQGNLRMGAMAVTGSNADNASWLVLNSLVGDPSAVSFQSMSLTPGVGGLCERETSDAQEESLLLITVAPLPLPTPDRCNFFLGNVFWGVHLCSTPGRYRPLSRAKSRSGLLDDVSAACMPIPVYTSA